MRRNKGAHLRSCGGRWGSRPDLRIKPAVTNKLAEQLAVLVSARQEARARFRNERKAATDAEEESTAV
jgi:hypothetical protein